MKPAENQPELAAIYLRISLDREMDGLAIERQRELCLKKCEQHNWKPIEPYYIDQSKSATDKTKRRPAYDKMVNDYKEGKFHNIVCYDLDRLTRQPRQMEDWIEEAEENGLRIVTANGDADLGTDAGRLFARLKAAVARSEVERMGNRRKLALKQHAEMGKVPTGPRLFGYTMDAEIIPEEAAIVRAIFEHVLLGMPIKTICRYLNGQDMDKPVADLPMTPKPSYHKAIDRNSRRIAKGLEPKELPEPYPWTNSTVTGLLRNPRYAGYSFRFTAKEREGKNPKVHRSMESHIVKDENGNPVKGIWEPLIEEADWHAVQDILNDPRRKKNRHGTARKHLGTGLFECGHCGKKVKAHGGEKRHHRNYHCEGCFYRRMDNIDDYVLAVIRERLGMPDLRDLLAKKESPRLKQISNEISTCNLRISRAKEAYLSGDFTLADFKKAKEQEEARIGVLEQERATHYASNLPTGVLGAADPVRAFDDAPLSIKRSVIGALCTVKIMHHEQGDKFFDGSDVIIEWKDDLNSV